METSLKILWAVIFVSPFVIAILIAKFTSPN